MPPNIFVSYSHADNSLVGPVVALLRASQALVFQDADSIRPGKRWREEVDTAISAASVVVVFWCRHAKASQEVETEFRAAIAQGKDILPLLLDETPLPGDLAGFQYIDFRAAFRKGHDIGLEQAAPQPAKRSWVLWFVGTIIAVVLLMSKALSTSSHAYGHSPPRFPLGLWLSVLGVGLALVGILVRRRRTQDHARLRLARTIEAELVRRTGGRLK